MCEPPKPHGRGAHSNDSTGRYLTPVYGSSCVRTLENDRQETMMSVKLLFLGGIGCLVVIGALTWCVTARAGYESAPYTVVESDGNIEIREYPDLVLASTEAKFETRGSDGSFMRLFGYISGDNESNQKIEMTTPVLMEPDSSAAKGQMGFVLPQGIAEAGAPAPKASNVTIRKREGGRFAVIRFSGVMDAKKAESQESQLRT